MKRLILIIGLLLPIICLCQRYDSTDFRLCSLVQVTHSMKTGGPGLKLIIVSGTDTVFMDRRTLSNKTRKEMEDCFLMDRETFEKLLAQKNKQKLTL